MSGSFSAMIFRFVRIWSAALVILAALIWSSFSILLRTHEASPAGMITIRLAHYQLEPGVRSGFDQLAKEYEKLHPQVRIVQDWVPSSAYSQWLTTQLISGEASDIVEQAPLPAPIALSFASRYFARLGEYTEAPNPYNQGTPLEAKRWKDTYFDGMRLAFSNELQEYIYVPLSQFGTRVIYNPVLLAKLTGRDQPPTQYADFLQLCDRIRKAKTPDGMSYIAIAGSKTHFPPWPGATANQLTFSLIPQCDFNHDGSADAQEVFIAWKNGLLQLTDPAIRAKYGVVRDIADRCQPGFTGLNRDEAVFQFIQQRAVFMTVGSYEAMALVTQAREAGFEPGIMDFPRPMPGDPGFEKFAAGFPLEFPISNFLFSVTRFSHHPEIAVDFLRFLSSQKTNEELNRTIGWIPCISGTSPRSELKAFAPHTEGISGISEPPVTGGETSIRWSQLLPLYELGQISYDELAGEYASFSQDRGLPDLLETLQNRRRSRINDLRGMAGVRALALNAADPDKARQFWATYSLLVARDALSDLSSQHRADWAAQGIPPSISKQMIQYSPEGLRAIRAKALYNPGTP